jgi:hypothetical protein
MIDLLLVNPSPNGIKLVNYLRPKELSYKIVITSGHMLGYASADENIIDLNTTSVDSSLQFKSAVAWNHAGQRFVEFIKDQIVLRNVDGLAENRLKSYLSISEFAENALIVETVSYKGRHVVNSVMVNNGGQWKLFKEQDHPYYIDSIEKAFNILDENGVINGPAQVFINENNHYIKLCPVDSEYVQRSVKKHYADIWPVVLKLEVDNPKKTLLSFYDWTERHGSSKKFQLA